MAKSCRHCIVMLALLLIASLPLHSGGRTETVGKGIKTSDITEFWYTYSSSTNPPRFQRYRFYVDGDVWHFYHEKREGHHWPLTEADVTISGDVVLSQDQVALLFSCLDGGTVKARGESADSGNAGPWLYLYWKKDKSKYQEFSFSTYSNRLKFEEFCEELIH